MTNHLAQLNVAKLRAPIDDPMIGDFVAGLDHVNAIAESASGFVWRLVGEGNDATSLRPFPDSDVIVNMSVWESVDSFKAFVYRSAHVEFFKRRDEWFHPPSSPMTVLWWVPAGSLPTVDEARRRLDFLAAHGPSPYAFGTGTVQQPLIVTPADLGDDDALGLIDRLNAELLARTPDGGRNFFRLSAADVEAGSGAFLVARLGGVPVGCGAVRLIDPTTVEVKRMYVDPATRGLRIGAAVLAELEALGRALGATRAVLETGPYLTEALAVYRRAGFADIPCWGEYAGLDHNCCLGKDL